jgi:twitching motility two-component system response regulator PilG
MTRNIVKPQKMSNEMGGKPQAQASPVKVMQEMANRGISGCLTISDPEDPSVGWNIYIGNQRLIYATSTRGKSERLPYLIQRFCPSVSTNERVDPKRSEYEDFCRWCRGGKFSLDELRKLLLRSSQDALSQALSLTRAFVQFTKGAQVEPLVLSVPLKDVVGSVVRSIKQWETLRPTLLSGFSRLDFNSKRLDDFCNHWEASQAGADPLISQFLRSQQMTACIREFSKKATIYEISTALGTEPLLLASWIHPLISSDVIHVLPYEKMEQRPVVACIDDSKTVQRQVQMTLQTGGYDVLGITEPSKALTELVRHRPVLILMDVNMPEIDGYELSRMLRQSKQLKDIPIVMLTGRDGLMDRLRAQVLGITEYITKPFEPGRLLQAVQKLALSNHPQS